MTRKSRSERLAFIVVAAVAGAALAGGSGALAAKPDRAPYEPGPLELEPGQACEFPVTIETLPGSNYTQTFFSDGREVITGSGRERVTNESNAKSIVLHSGGTSRFTVDGDNLLIELSGRGSLYFFAGDQGPFGEVGADGALYSYVGRVEEVLDLNQDLITSATLNGRATELCSLIR